MLNDISGKEMWKNWKEFDGRYAAKKFYSYPQACKVASACGGEVVKGEAI